MAPAKQRRTTVNAVQKRVARSSGQNDPKGVNSTAKPSSPVKGAEGDSNAEGGAVDPRLYGVMSYQPEGPSDAARGFNRDVKGSRCQLGVGLSGADWCLSNRDRIPPYYNEPKYDAGAFRFNVLQIIGFRQDLQLQIRENFHNQAFRL
jgi:hypothetical protein